MPRKKVRASTISVPKVEGKDINDVALLKSQSMKPISTHSGEESKVQVGEAERPLIHISEMSVPTESKLRIKLEENSYDLATSGSLNRRILRQIFDGIFLPSLLSIRKRKAEEVKEDFEKLKLLKDPKIKKNIAALLPKTLKDRLKPIGLDIQDQYFAVDQVTRETMVTRFFMSSQYGGNMQETFPRPSKKFLDKHGMDDFMFLPTEYQPEAPQLPGAPGLWFCTTSGEDLVGTLRVFVKIILAAGSKKSVYQYQGMYEVHAADPPSLTVQEWCDQPPRFHNKWANAIVKMGWGSGVCARTLLRRELSREPTPLEVEETITSGRHKAITADEVKEAYFQGKERMGVWTMKCVGYDNRFQQELHDTFPTWVPPPPKKPKREDGQTPEKRKRRNVKAKDRRSSDSESEGEGVESEASYSDEEDAPKPKRVKRDPIKLPDDEDPVSYKTRGTRSRPIYL